VDTAPRSRSNTTVTNTADNSLDGAFAHAIDVLSQGWYPTRAGTDAIVEFTWRGVPQQFAECRVDVTDDGPTITCAGDGVDAIAAPNTDHDFFGSMEARFADGRVLQSPDAFVRSATFGWGSSTGDGARAVISMPQWHLTTTATPLVWLARIEGDFEVMPGNLTVTHKWKGQDGTLRTHLSGQHVLIRSPRKACFVRQAIGGSKTSWLVLEGAEAPDTQQVHELLLASQFALGKRVGIRHFLGLDEKLATVAELGHRFGEAHPPRARETPAIPVRFGRRPWIVPMVESLCSALAGGRIAGLHSILAHYVEAAADRYIDSQYLRLAVALRAASALAPAQHITWASIDPNKFAEWVDAQSNSVRALAQPQLSDLLIERIRGADALPDATLVAWLRALGWASVEKLSGETKLFDVIFATGELPLSKDDTSGSVARVDLLRAALVRLVSAFVGYLGPLGSDSKGDADVEVPRYVITREEPPQASLEWGDFEIPALPPQLEIFRALADSLEAKTASRIGAALYWSPPEPDRLDTFEFVVFPKGSPASQAVLFSVAYDNETTAVLATDWLGVGRVLGSANEVHLFVREVIESPAVRERLLRILAGTQYSR